MKNKLVFIGNSIVNGFPMSRGRSFPGQIRAVLKEAHIADVINKGVNGETTAEMLGRFDHDVLAHAPNAVFIMSGTNDFIYREADPAECMANLNEMAQKAEDAGIIPIYMTPLGVDEEKASRRWMAGVGIDYRKINEEIETFSKMIRESGRLFIDTGAAWKAYTEGVLPGGIAEAYLDGVHPTPEGHEFLAGFILSWMEDYSAKLGLIG